MKSKFFKTVAIFLFIVFALFSISCKQEEIHYNDQIVYIGDKPVADDDKDLVCNSYESFLLYSGVSDPNNPSSPSETKTDSYKGIKTYHFRDKPHGQGFVDVKFFFTFLQDMVSFGLPEYIINPKYEYNLTKNILLVSYDTYYGEAKTVEFDWLNDIVTFSSFPNTKFPSANANMDEDLQFYPEYFAGGKKTVIDLKKYHYDILFYNGACLMPFYVGQDLFLNSYIIPIYFLESNLPDDKNCYYFVDFSDIIGEMKNKYKTDTIEVPYYVREDTWNSLMFILDNFYGLNERKKILFGNENALFSDYEDTLLKEYKDAILNTDKKVFSEGLEKFIRGFMDEGHCKVTKLSYFTSDEMQTSLKNMEESYFDGPNRKKLLSTRAFFKDLKKERGYSDDDNVIGKNVYFSDSGKTAYINFNMFEDGDENKPGSISFFKTQMQSISKRLDSTTSNKVENVVLDITSNGGGSEDILEYILGMMTNKTVTSIELNRKNNTVITSEWKSNTNDDNIFDENDGYPDLNWYILTSNFSFSCANALPTIAQFSGLAKVVGEKSGGGICIVRSEVLPDGSNINVSSNNVIAGEKIDLVTGKREYYFSENGIEPDIPLNREEFYCEDWQNWLEKKITGNAE